MKHILKDMLKKNLHAQAPLPKVHIEVHITSGTKLFLLLLSKKESELNFELESQLSFKLKSNAT